MISASELKSKGMRCLTEQMGVVEAEMFVSMILREQFDYTKWQREYYDAMKPGDFMRGALDYAKTHPFEGKAKHIKL